MKASLPEKNFFDSLMFLNAKLENFETAYETFFFAYGFKILKEIDENYTFELKGKYTIHEEYINEVTKIYNDLQYEIKNIQNEMKEFVDHVYNINDKEELKENSMLVSMIDTHQSNDLSAICYAVLEKLVKPTNNPIKKC